MCIAFLIIAKDCDTSHVFKYSVRVPSTGCKMTLVYSALFSEAKDHILILNILFFNKLSQIIHEIRSERRALLIFIFILKTTGTCTAVHSAGDLILRNELRSTQET
jgi:hypothetical protein